MSRIAVFLPEVNAELDAEQAGVIVGWDGIPFPGAPGEYGEDFGDIRFDAWAVVESMQEAREGQSEIDRWVGLVVWEGNAYVFEGPEAFDPGEMDLEDGRVRRATRAEMKNLAATGNIWPGVGRYDTSGCTTGRSTAGSEEG